MHMKLATVCLLNGVEGTTNQSWSHQTRELLFGHQRRAEADLRDAVVQRFLEVARTESV